MFSVEAISAAEVPQSYSTSLSHGELQLEETESSVTIRQSGKLILNYDTRFRPAPDGIDPVYQRSGFLDPVASPAGQIVKEPVVDILRERWRITAFATDGSFHGFDLQTTQHALTDKPLVIQEYHYGGVAFRGRVRWLTAGDGDAQKWEESSSKTLFRDPSEFRNDLGSDRIKGNHEHARWVSLYGINYGNPVTITVLCHRDNFHAPQAARLHPTKPYFAFSPCVDGEFIIDRDHPFTGRYRYLLTDAAPDVKWLNEQWDAWHQFD